MNTKSNFYKYIFSFLLIFLNFSTFAQETNPKQSSTFQLAELNESTLKTYIDIISGKAKKEAKKEIGTSQIPPVITAIIKEGRQYLGKPYRYRSRKTGMLDCSGLLFLIYRRHGFQIPRTSRAMHKLCKRVTKPRVGDLIFFRGTRTYHPRSVGHVAMIVAIKGKTIYMMHSCSRGVVWENFTDRRAYEKRFISFGRIPNMEKEWDKLAQPSQK